MSNPAFTTMQNYVRTIEGRIASLNIYKAKGYEAEVERMKFALADVIKSMPKEELDALRAVQNKVLTPAERAAEATRIAKAMEENRDKPSI